MSHVLSSWEQSYSHILSDYPANSLPGLMVRYGMDQVRTIEDALSRHSDQVNVKRLEEWLIGYTQRLQDCINYDRSFTPSNGQHSPYCQAIDYDSSYTYPSGAVLPDNISAIEVLHEYSPIFAGAIMALYKYFPFSEIDTPSVLLTMARQARLGNVMTALDGNLFYNRYLLVVLKELGSGRLAGVVDGSLLVSSNQAFVYGAHIWVSQGLRGQGLGRVLEGAFFSAANKYMPGAYGKLAGKIEKAGNHPSMRLRTMVIETEFGSIAPQDIQSSLTRLIYHAKTGKRIIWPFAYAQSDTDYRLPHFEMTQWRPVPLFLAIRRVGAEEDDAIDRNEAIETANLLLDSFSRPAISQGIIFDKGYLEGFTPKDDRLRLVRPPLVVDQIPEFFESVGEAREIMTKLYPDHLFTREWLQERPIKEYPSVKEAIDQIRSGDHI